MNKTDSRFVEIFHKYPDIQAVYLFGSSATGKTHRESDLDLAVVPRSHLVRGQKLNILTDLARLGFDNIDLIFLDVDDIVLRYEAIKHNQLIYQSEDFDRGTLYSTVVRQYLDFLPFLKVQRDAYKRRILNGQ